MLQFFPSKNLGGAGDGGMITTNDPALDDRLRVLRVHGGVQYQYELLGINSRLDELQAAVLSVKLPHLERWTSLRRRNADRYRSLFKQFKLESESSCLLPGPMVGMYTISSQSVQIDATNFANV